MWKSVDSKWICSECGFVSPTSDKTKAPEGPCFMCAIRNKGWVKSNDKKKAASR